MPAPIEPSPAPMPSATALRPSSVSPLACAMRVVMDVLLSVAVSGRCFTDVDGSQRREDEGLQGGHQPDLEEEEGERERKRRDPQQREPQQDRQPAAHEQQQEMAGQDVREQSDRQGDDPNEL